MISRALLRLRSAAKHAAERTLLASGVPRMTRLRRLRDVLILAYHNVVPDGAPPCGDVPLHLPRARFAEQLDILRETHDIVPLAEVLDPRSTGRGRPRAVVTFDDAYQGALTIGVGELASRGLPATVLVAPRFVGGAAFWWDSVAAAAGVDEASFRARALREAAGRDATVRELAAGQGMVEQVVPVYARCASEAELNEAVARASITIGSHGWSHANLEALPRAELHDELRRPLLWLRERWDCVLPVLAYPYGIVSDRVVVAAREAGYSFGLRIDGGWLRGRPSEPLLAPRVPISAGLTAAGFALRASGLLAS